MKNVPKDWKIMRMAEAGKIDGGRQRSPHLTDGKMRPYLRVANVMDGYIDVSDVKQMKFRDSEFEQYKLHAGDILLNEGQSLELCGRPAIYRGVPPNCCFQNTLIRFRPSGETDGLFALQLFKFLLTSGRFASIASKTTSIAHLGVSRFAGLKAAFPPINEQPRIASILEACDRGIETQQALLAAKQERKRGLMQQLLTGKTRFKEFVKSDKKVKTRYGDFPADWSQAHMGDIADEVGKKNAGGRELPVLSCTKHRGLVNSLEYFGKRIFSEDTSTYRIVERGDFAYATNHVEEGSIGYQNLHDAALISPMYTVFRTRAGVDHEFFWKLIKTELYRHIFEVNTSGSIARRGALRWDEFALIKVFLPSVPEQKRIAAVLNTCDREIELLEKQLEALKEQKRGLMQKLLTGEVRVKV